MDSVYDKKSRRNLIKKVITLLKQYNKNLASFVKIHNFIISPLNS